MAEITRARAEIAEYEQTCMKEMIVATLVMARHEQEKTESLLKFALPQLKNNTMLLSSFGEFPKENELYKVKNRNIPL